MDTNHPKPVKVNFKELDPLSIKSCNHCKHIYYDIDKGFRCPIHKDIEYTGAMIYMVNDCEDYLSCYVNDYRRRYDLERELEKGKSQPVNQLKLFND